jgi:hypothetical protein
MDKVVPYAQFPFPSLENLVTPLRDLSVYRLFWSSMGTSTLYAAFAGGMEVVAAGFLCFRRTTVLGALLGAAAMANVAVLNFGFDIPVKVFSVHLFLMSIFVLAGDFIRLANFLLLDRPVAAADDGGIWPGGWYRVARLALKSAFFLYVSVSSIKACIGIQHMRVTRSPLYGIYDVTEFAAGGAVRPPLTTDTVRWKTVIFNAPDRIWIKRMDDTVQSMAAAYDRDKGTLTIPGKEKTDTPANIRCSRPDSQHLTIDGSFQNESISVKLTRVDESKFPLAKSRVHWIPGRE